MGIFHEKILIHQKQNTSKTCTALISFNIEKVCQKSLVYQEKLFVSKIPSLTMWCPWNLFAKQEILVHRLNLKQSPERNTASSWVHVHCTVFYIGGIFRGTWSVLGRFLQDLKSRIVKTTDFIPASTIPRWVEMTKAPGKPSLFYRALASGMESPGFGCDGWHSFGVTGRFNTKNISSSDIILAIFYKSLSRQ